MEIPVIIPWNTHNNLGQACNTAMEQIFDWAILLDHDVLMLNPEWYRILCRTAQKIGHRSGWISGVTNSESTRSPMQTSKNAPSGHDIMQHLKYAKQVYNQFKETIKIYPQWETVFSGFMILTHRKAWETVGKFKDGYPVDSDYHYRLIKHGYQAHILPGLYMYHMHANKQAWHNF